MICLFHSHSLTSIPCKFCNRTMQKQVCESTCLLLSQTLKRFVKMSNTTTLLTTYLFLLESTVIFCKNMLFISIHNSLIFVILDNTSIVFNFSILISNMIEMNWYRPRKQKLFKGSSIMSKSVKSPRPRFFRTAVKDLCFASALKSYINAELRGPRTSFWVFTIKATFRFATELKGIFVWLYATQNPN